MSRSRLGFSRFHRRAETRIRGPRTQLTPGRASLGVRRPLAGCALAAACLASPGAVGAQQVERWEAYAEPCERDRRALRLVEIARFGDAEGDGIIESDIVGVSWGEDVGYLVRDGASGISTRIKVFARDGTFQRVIGRRGDGPGEFRALGEVHVVEDRIVALDAGRRTWVVFDLAGEFLEHRSFGLSGRQFVSVGEDRVVVGSMDASPKAVGFPLHLASLADGTPSLHFGAADPDWNISDPFAFAVTIAKVNRPGAILVAKGSGPAVEEWSLDNAMVWALHGNLPWFPQADRIPDPRTEPPPARLDELAADRDDGLWLASSVADARWRDIRFPATGEAGVPYSRLREYRDGRLDVFDLRRRCHVGARTWDAPTVELLDHGGVPAAAVVEHGEGMTAQVAVYRVEWRGEGPSA